MYNTNKWIGKKYGALIVLSDPFTKMRRSDPKTKNKNLKTYCTICGNTKDCEIPKLKRRSVVACSKRCTKIHLDTLPLGYWEDNEISIEECVNYLIKKSTSKGIYKKDSIKHNVSPIHQKQICDLYIEQNKKCILLRTRLYLGKSTEDRYRTASIDRIDNLLPYEHINNDRWIHKRLNEMLNCGSDETLIKMSHLIAEANPL